MSVWVGFFFFSSKTRPDTKEQRRLHSFLMSFTLFLSEQTATHSSSLSLSHTHASTEHHTLLAGCLLQKRRGGLRWWMPQTPSPTPAHYRLLWLFLPSDGKVMADVKGWNIFISAFLRRSGRKALQQLIRAICHSLVTSSGAAFIQLHQLSARTKALQSPLISQGPGMRMRGSMERRNTGEEREMVKHEGWGCWKQESEKWAHCVARIKLRGNVLAHMGSHWAGGSNHLLGSSLGIIIQSGIIKMGVEA